MVTWLAILQRIRTWSGFPDPESVVTSVSKAVAEITVTGFTSDISTSAEIRLYDADGNAVDDPNITQNIKSVNVQVSILQTKEVPLVFHTQGEPTYGYGFTGNVECDLADRNDLWKEQCS